MLLRLNVLFFVKTAMAVDLSGINIKFHWLVSHFGQVESCLKNITYVPLNFLLKKVIITIFRMEIKATKLIKKILFLRIHTTLQLDSLFKKPLHIFGVPERKSFRCLQMWDPRYNFWYSQVSWNICRSNRYLHPIFYTLFVTNKLILCV